MLKALEVLQKTKKPSEALGKTLMDGIIEEFFSFPVSCPIYFVLYAWLGTVPYCLCGLSKKVPFISCFLLILLCCMSNYDQTKINVLVTFNTSMTQEMSNILILVYM